MTAEHFQRLRTLISFEIHRVERALERLRAKHYPSPVARSFVDFLKDWLCKRRESIEDIDADFEVDPMGASDRLKSEHRRVLDRLHFLDAIENATSDQVPWSLIPAVERLAENLIPNRKILTTATSELNYGIQWYRGESDPLSRFFMLYLPKIHRANSFLHLLVPHEFFHPILDPFFANQIRRVAPVFHDGCKKILDSTGYSTDDLFGSKRIDEMVEGAMHIWRRGLEEVMCDLGCAFILGPSALLSATLFALAQNLDECPSSQGNFYPPWRYRLRTVLKCVIDSEEGILAIDRLKHALATEGFNNDSSNLVSTVESTRRIIEEVSHLTAFTGPLVKLAYMSVDSAMGAACDFIRGIVQPIDCWTSTVDEVPHLLRHLDLLVPPGEVIKPGSRSGKPASLSGIALAGWIYHLRHENAGESTQRDATFRRTCRLMLKAIEDAEFKRTFANRSTERGS